jgi:hypothetical protein
VCNLETSRIGTPYVYIHTHIYDISSLSVNDLTFILLTWKKWLAPNDASRQQMGFNSGFKGLILTDSLNCENETANRTLQTGSIIVLLTDKSYYLRGRYFNVNPAKLIVRNALH